MIKYAAVNSQRHKDMAWQRNRSYEFSSRMHVVPLVGAEISRAALSLPVAYAAFEDHYILVGVTSFIAGHNMFVSPGGKWLGRYVPSELRGYPFKLLKQQEKEGLVMCIDENAAHASENIPGGQPFFDNANEMAGPLKEVFDFLKQVEDNRVATRHALGIIAELGLIKNWPLKITFNNEEREVTGLLKTDEARLNSLDDQAFIKLRKSGALPLIYGQLLSMGNTEIITQLAAARQKMEQSEIPDVERFLRDDDMLKF